MQSNAGIICTHLLLIVFFCRWQDHVEGYLRDIFDFERVRYLTVEEMAEDVWALAKERREAISRQMPTRRWPIDHAQR